MILALEIIGLRVFQNFLISVIFFSLRLLQFRFAFLNNDTEKYLYLVYFFRFSSFLFSRKLFFNSVLFFISLLNVLFMNCDWFLLTYVFFRGECLSNTSTYILKKLWKRLSFVLNWKMIYQIFSEKLIFQILVTSLVYNFRFNFMEVCFNDCYYHSLEIR